MPRICALLALLLVVGCTRDPGSRIEPPASDPPPPEYEPPSPEPSPAGSSPDSPIVDAAVAKERGGAHACAASSSDPPGKQLLGHPRNAISELGRDRVDPSAFDTEGWVVRHFVPIACPPKAICKPQPPPYLVLGDAEKDPQSSLLLETPKPGAFPVGTKLEVSVGLCNTQTYGGQTNEGHLLAAVRAK